MGNQTHVGGGEDSPLTLFRVRDGFRFGAFSEYGPGDVLELPASVVTAFGDKLEAIAPAVCAAPEPEPVPDDKPRGKRSKGAKDENA